MFPREVQLEGMAAVHADERNTEAGDLNDSKSNRIAAIVAPTPTVTWTADYYSGQEQSDNDSCAVNWSMTGTVHSWAIDPRGHVDRGVRVRDGVMVRPMMLPVDRFTLHLQQKARALASAAQHIGIVIGRPH
jgi:hypothetical protein